MKKQKTVKTIVGVFVDKDKSFYIYDTVKETVKNDFYLKLAKFILEAPTKEPTNQENKQKE